MKIRALCFSVAAAVLIHALLLLLLGPRPAVIRKPALGAAASTFPLPLELRGVEVLPSAPARPLGGEAAVVAQSSRHHAGKNPGEAATPQADAQAQPVPPLSPPSRDSPHSKLSPLPQVEPAAPSTMQPPMLPQSLAQSLAQPLPLYPTRMPPSAQLSYSFQRGTLQAQAELQWRRLPGAAPPGYEARLSGVGAAEGELDWRSQGGIDGAGLAPQRFVTRRKGRGAQAANFQRDQGRISFSGTAAAQALTTGTQDGLSWLLQLSAVLEALSGMGEGPPQKLDAGREVMLHVVGSRGDADVWRFVVKGAQELVLPGWQEPIHTVLLERSAQRAFDVAIQLWLSPQHHHLPARLRWVPTGGGAPMELSLLELRFLQ